MFKYSETVMEFSSWGLRVDFGPGPVWEGVVFFGFLGLIAVGIPGRVMAFGSTFLSSTFF